MSEATCAVLSAIFPLILVTGVLERRVANIKIRRLPFYRWTNLVTFTCALLGTAYAVFGVWAGGFSAIQGIVIGAIFIAALGGLGIVLLASIATAEIDEEPKKKKEARAKAD